ncbi:LamG-like jellyroll fold domain-containing protein [Planctomycetota bacterium]
MCARHVVIVLGLFLLGSAQAGIVIDHDYSDAAQLDAWVAPAPPHIFEHHPEVLRNMEGFLLMVDNELPTPAIAKLPFGFELPTGRIEVSFCGMSWADSGQLRLMAGDLMVGEIRLQSKTNGFYVNVNGDDSTLVHVPHSEDWGSKNEPPARSFVVTWENGTINYWWTQLDGTLNSFPGMPFVDANGVAPDSIEIETGADHIGRTLWMDDLVIWDSMGQIPQPLPLAQYTFDDGTTVDVTGNGNDGILLGVAPDPNDPNDPNMVAEVVEDPNRGMVMKINKQGMLVEGPVDINESFTLSAWIKIDLEAPDINRGLSGRSYFSTAEQKWLIRADDKTSNLRDAIEINIPYSPRNFWDKMDTTAGGTMAGILDGQWHHVAVVLKDGVEVTGYYDGEAVMSSTKTAPVSLGGTVVLLNFGGDVAGFMDDIAVYNVALNDEGVADIMLSSTPIITVETMDSIAVTGDDGDILSLDGIDVNDLVLASIATDFEKHDGSPAVNGENFSLGIYASLDDASEIVMMFPEPVGAVFIIDRGGNDKGYFQALDADAVPFGALSNFSNSDWLKPGFSVSGQAGGGIRLIADRPIYGVRVTPDGTMGLDPVSVSGIPVSE